MMEHQNESENTDENMTEDDEHSIKERQDDKHSILEERQDDKHSILEERQDDEQSIPKERQDDEQYIPEERQDEEHSIPEERQDDEHSIQDERQNDENSILEERQDDEHSIQDERQDDEHSIPEERQDDEHSIQDERQDDEHSIQDERQDDEHSIQDERQVDENSIPEERQDDEHSIQDERQDDEHSIPEERLRSSSSVSSVSDIESAITDFSFEDPYQIDRNEHGSLTIDHEQCDAPDETLSGDTPALDSPPVQVMERPADTSDYRIPSYVFATNKSSNPDWSTASNESLFSIHTGNMSFTGDQFSWLLKSGELGMYGPGFGVGDTIKPGDLPPPSPRHVPKSGGSKTVELRKEEQMPISSQETLKSGEDIIAAHFKTLPTTLSPFDQEPAAFRVEEVTDLAIGMKKDDPIFETKDKISSASDDIPLPNSISHHSDASGQSFAFPVLTEIGRDKSVNSGHSHIRANQRKNSMINDQEAAKSPKPTNEVAPTSSSSLYSWFYYCISYCSCCCDSNSRKQEVV